MCPLDPKEGFEEKKTRTKISRAGVLSLKLHHPKTTVFTVPVIDGNPRKKILFFR
jgi:hypothetical protein